MTTYHIEFGEEDSLVFSCDGYTFDGIVSPELLANARRLSEWMRQLEDEYAVSESAESEGAE